MYNKDGKRRNVQEEATIVVQAHMSRASAGKSKEAELLL